MELSKLSGFDHWYCKGVPFLHQLFVQGQFRSFKDLQGEFDISSHRFFQYLQLHHAVSIRDKKHNMRWISTPLIDFLANSEKGLISSLYRMLLDKSLANTKMPGRKGWEKQVQMVSLSPTQRLSQLFVIHRSYITPIEIHR